LPNYKIVLSYDGTGYHGFQFQRNALTIQAILERSLEKLYGKKIKVRAAGRTDAGVHAKGQVANFFAPASISEERLPLALNSLLPKDIVVLGAGAVADDFDARKSSVAKIYTYTIDNGPFADVFIRNYAWHIPRPLDLEAMKRAASFLLGKHDFKAFQGAGSSVEDTVRVLYALDIERLGSKTIVITCRGNGFLYKMVRNITGTLVEVGLLRRLPQEIPEILERKDRRKAGITAPARGLCLEAVLY